MYTIRKQFEFSASHCLDQLPDEHPCSRTHGHNYVVVIELRMDVLNKYGFVLDYRSLSNVKSFIDQELDHRHLNDVMTGHPTAENIAKFIYDTFADELHPFLRAVEVSETPKTNARYER